MLRKLSISILSGLAVMSAASQAAEYNTVVPMHEKGAVTYYVKGQIDGYGATEFMVDTGSGYATINEETLSLLKQQGRAQYVKNLSGILADGTRRVVPVYLISSINIGGDCLIKDVEAAVFPGSTRLILGLSALKKTAPFAFTLNPPSLKLSNCKAEPGAV